MTGPTEAPETVWVYENSLNGHMEAYHENGPDRVAFARRDICEGMAKALRLIVDGPEGCNATAAECRNTARADHARFDGNAPQADGRDNADFNGDPEAAGKEDAKAAWAEARKHLTADAQSDREAKRDAALRECVEALKWALPHAQSGMWPWSGRPSDRDFEMFEKAESALKIAEIAL